MIAQAWIPVIAAFGASVLTAVAAVGISFLQHKLSQRRGRQRTQFSAYADLLCRAVAFERRVRSFSKEALRNYKLDSTGEKRWVAIGDSATLYELRVWLDQDARLLANAWSAVSAVATPEILHMADQLVDSCRCLLETAPFDDAHRLWLPGSIVINEEAPIEHGTAFKDLLAQLDERLKVFEISVRQKIGNTLVESALKRAISGGGEPLR